MTEISASDKLEEFRSEQEGYLGASFAPISAFADHGAVIHYSATEESNAELKEGKLFLTDTGGALLGGVYRHYQDNRAGESQPQGERTFYSCGKTNAATCEYCISSRMHRGES